MKKVLIIITTLFITVACSEQDIEPTQSNTLDEDSQISTADGPRYDIVKSDGVIYD